MSKYGARKTIIDNITFDSAAEARRYQQLVLLQKAGEITWLEAHKSFELEPKAGKLRAITHVVDFYYFEPGQGVVVEDVKGVATAVWRLKYNLFQRRYPNIEYRVIRAKDV